MAWQLNTFRGPPVDIFELTSSSSASPPHFFDNVFMLSASRNWLTKVRAVVIEENGLSLQY